MPVTDFLHKLGLKSTKKRGSEVWFHAPYRSDKTPSFCVNTEKNIYNEYVSFCRWHGRQVNSIKFRRQVEYDLFFVRVVIQKFR